MSENQVLIEMGEGVSLPSALTAEAIEQVVPLFMDHLGLEGRYVTLLICDKEEMTELNATYRGKEKPTDILSWDYEEDEDLILPAEEMPWGEMALCMDVCAEQAQDSGWEVEKEVFRLLAHGLVHLMGYDHLTDEEEKVMLAKELELLDLIGLSELYN